METNSANARTAMQITEESAAASSEHIVSKLRELGFQPDHLRILQSAPQLLPMVLDKYPDFGYGWEEEELFDSDNQPKTEGGITHSGPAAGYSSEKPPKLSPAQFMRILSVGLQASEAVQASEEALSDTTEAVSDVVSEVGDVLAKVGELIEKGFTYAQVDTLLNRTTDREIWDTIAEKIEDMTQLGITNDEQVSQAVVRMGSEAMYIFLEMIQGMAAANAAYQEAHLSE